VIDVHAVGEAFRKQNRRFELKRQTAAGHDEPTATSKSGFAFSHIAEKKKINANVDLFRLLEARPDGQGWKLPSASGFQQWRQAIVKVYVKEAG
jgi:hypothetical protein